MKKSTFDFQKLIRACNNYSAPAYLNDPDLVEEVIHGLGECLAQTFSIEEVPAEVKPKKRSKQTKTKRKK